MTVATKSNRTLKIDGMSGVDCVKKVNGALKNISNVSTHHVKVGSASIEADDTGCASACKAIEGVGFKAHENAAKDEKAAIPLNGAKTEPHAAGKSPAPSGAAPKPAPGTR
tara:strand:+ start:365 stop:697 length:333 start_codon:yes stop_codon:yes gene_type:complete